jgi:hypothetical protein
MEIKTNTTGSVATLEKIARQENEIYIRIFFPNGKFINYLVDPNDVEKYGMGTIFEVIDPDPDWLQAKEIYSSIQSKPKRKNTSRIAA